MDGARALEFSKQHGMVGYVESSAKDNNNVELVFMQIAEVVARVEKRSEKEVESKGVEAE